MDTNKNKQQHLLDFASFIKDYIPTYKFDANNEKIIWQLGLWANRNEKFNGLAEGWHIDRGILIFGAPGTGKDELFRNLRKYISYLRTSYGYGHRIVWQYAKEFMKDKVGYSCFDQDKGNLYYEELALTDEDTGEVRREMVQSYGNKLLIGKEIIHIRNNQFKEYGWQTHFSTNCNEQQLMDIYGERCVDRLYEMCNFIFLPGKSKRGKLAPVFIKNVNQAAPPAARETTIDEHEENRRLLEEEYQVFLKEGTTSDKVSLNYYLLISYGCNLGTEEDLRLIMELVEGSYVEPDAVARGSKAQHKKDYIWENARKVAVQQFYFRMKEGGAKSIFKEVEVNASDLVLSIIDDKNLDHGTT